MWEEGAFEPYREVGYGQQDDPVPAYACSDYNLVTACVIPTAVMEMGLESVKPCIVIASARVECPMRWFLNLLGLHFPIYGYNNTYSAKFGKKSVTVGSSILLCSEDRHSHEIQSP